MSEKSKIKQITIIGAGSWGTAVAKVIAENNPNLIVKMWSYEKSTANSINLRNINFDYLPGVKLPPNIKATTHLKDSVAGSMGLMIATPSKVIPDTVMRLAKLVESSIPIAYLTKGFCRINNEIMTISQAIGHLFPEHRERVVGIYGPSHAEEVALRYHTCLNIAGKSSRDRRFFTELLNCDYLQCRETEDLLGVDLGGTLKNPAAIAAGMISILPECGDNLAGALMSESLKEMINLGKALGADINTIIDISGTGDLVATSLSDHSRNRRFGKDIARQILEKGSSLTLYDKIYLRFKPEHVLEKMSQKLHYLAEGAYAIEPLIELAELHSVPIPVYRSLYEVLLNKKEPSLLIETIKNPHKFDEIYHNAKLHVKDRKKGLERVRGKAFRKFILQQIEIKFSSQNSNVEFQGPSILSNLKSMILPENLKKGTFFNDELKLITELTVNNYDKTIKKLTAIYLNEIIDYYNIFIKRLYLKFQVLRHLKYRITGNRNTIKITGELNELHRLKDTANIIYVARYKNLYDFIYYIYAIKKSNLPVPRFFISSEAIHGRLKKFLIRSCGGYFIDTGKLNNILYRECIIQYISTMISSGVPVLYFPEIEPEKNSEISSLSENFFQIINEVLYRDATEIVLIPSEIAYKNKLNESEIKPVLSEPVHMNFSAPVFLSDFTKQSQALTPVSEMIQNIWAMDEIIFPHHIICGILAEKNYIIKQSKLRKYIDKFVSDNFIVTDKNSRQISAEGIKFLLKNRLINKRDNQYNGIENDIIKKFADIIKRKNLNRI